MTGHLDKAQRSWNMSRIRGKDTSLEIVIMSNILGLTAKAYHFKRNSGFSTAYIGSANMSHAAITSGLEWNLKVTSQDMGHILEKFSVEFETYWNSREFIHFDAENPTLFRTAIDHARNRQSNGPAVFFDLRPHPFQERILEALERERTAHDRWRNLWGFVGLWGQGLWGLPWDLSR
jgi:hypothetical protein